MLSKLTNVDSKFVKQSYRNKLKLKLQAIDWNLMHRKPPKEKNIPQLFEEQVAKTPHNTAVVFGNQELSYLELNQKANQLANYLRSLGVKSDTLIALSVERSLDLIIGLIAILKLGCAYVPLDPCCPKERLSFILEDTKAYCLLSQENLLSNFSNYPNQIICIDKEWPEIEKQPHTSDLKITCDSEHLAYVIYTSGSTGKPKGVKVSHQNVCRLFSATKDYYQFNDKDVWTLFHSFAFDFSVWEIWGALFYGGKIIIVPHLASRSCDAFYDLLEKHQVTVLNQTPSAFQQFINYESSLHQVKKLKLRYVIFGGEPLNPSMLKPWFERHPDHDPQLINMYGITECTVHVTHQLIKASDADQSKSLIGHPLSDLKIYILDAKQQLVPMGVEGEIYIGGAGVTQGYLNRADLTAERFIVNPFANNKNLDKLLYRSGDIARYLPDGNIEYLGRIDNQVKIRGFRIECGEVEFVIRQHPDIQDVVVSSKESDSEQKYLVAYFTLKTSVQTEDCIEQIRMLLNKQLPNYMIPHYFMLLEQIPLTLNGKVDHKALPIPDQYNRNKNNPYEAPQNEIERKLAEIWAEILKLDTHKISIHDNFFNLGGNSLLLIQLAIKVNKFLSSSLSVNEIYCHPSIASLNALVTKKILENTKVEPTLLPIRTTGEEPPLFLVHPSAGLALPYLCFSELNDRAVYGITNPFFGMTNGFRSISEMATNYIDQIKKIKPKGPYCLGGWSFGGTVALEMAQQLTAMGEKIEVVILIDVENDTNASVVNFNKQVEQEKIKGWFGELDSVTIDAICNDTYRSNLLLSTHIPQKYNGRTILLKATESDGSDGIETQTTSQNQPANPFNGWENILSNLEVKSVIGKHDSLFEGENFREIVNKISRILKSKPPAIFKQKHLKSLEQNFLFAAQQQNTFLIDLYLKCNVSINIKDELGRTALHWAAHYGNQKMVSLLMNAHADTNQTDHHGATPAALALQQGHVQLAKSLQEVCEHEFQ